MPLTNFQKVKQFMTAFGQATFDSPQRELIKDEKLFNFRFSLIDEEFKEIIKAVECNDFVEVVDGIADLLVVTYGAGHAFGIDMDEYIKTQFHKYPISIGYEVLEYMFEVNTENKTNYQFIREKMIKYNELVCTIPQPRLLKGAVEFVSTFLSVIQYPIYSLRFAKTFSNVQRMLYNILIATYRLSIVLGIDVDEAFDIVHQSNMSKLCSSEEEAQKTVEWYKTDAESKTRYPTPAHKPASDGEHWIVYEQSTGKILKSINYTPADLKKFAQ